MMSMHTEDEVPPLVAQPRDHILVTRPAHQSEPLMALLRAQGVHALCYPLLRIEPVSDPRAAQAALAQALTCDIVVFTSVNAVAYAAQLCPQLTRRLRSVRLAALGRGTQRALREHHCESPVLRADGSTSEDLLAHEAFSPQALASRRVALVTGEGGRGLLARVLSERAGQLNVAAVYRRSSCGEGFAAFLSQFGDDVAVAIITSGEALTTLTSATPSAWNARVREWSLVVSSERVAQRARKFGFKSEVVPVRDMSDAALASAAIHCLSEH